MGLQVRNGKVDFVAGKDPIRCVGPLNSVTAYKEKIIEHTLTTGGLTSTITAAIPDGAFLIGFTVDVLEKITTGGDRTTMKIGETAGGTQFSGTVTMSSQSVAAGTRYTPKDSGAAPSGGWYIADQDIVIQFSGGTTGNITGGKIRVILRFWQSS